MTTFVGAGAWQTATGSAGNPHTHTAVPLPAGLAEGDVLYALCASNLSTGAPDWTATGWTEIVTVTNGNLHLAVLRKVAGASEAAPDITVSDRGGGNSVFIAAWRGQHATTIEEATNPGGGGSALLYTVDPPLTTLTDLAMVVEFVMVDEDHAISLDTAQGFTLVTDSSFVTTLGGDHAVGMAYAEIPTAGAITEPTWAQATAGTVWVSMTFAIAPAADTDHTRTVTDAADAADTISPAAGYARDTTDLAGAADSLVPAAGYARAAADVADAQDDLVTALIGGTSITDPADATDTLTVEQTHARDLTDVAGAVDSLAPAATVVRTLVDVAEAVDDLGTTHSGGGGTAHTVGITDAAAVVDQGGTWVLPEQTGPDTAAAVDTLVAVQTHRREITDVAAAVDSGFGSVGEFDPTELETADITDSLTVEVTGPGIHARQIDDQAGIGDDLVVETGVDLPGPLHRSETEHREPPDETTSSEG